MSLLCLFRDTPVEVVSVPCKSVNLTFTLRVHHVHMCESAVPVGEYFVMPQGIQFSLPHRLSIEGNGEVLCVLAFTTTPQTISHSSCPAGKGEVVYYTTTDSQNGNVQNCSFALLSDGSDILNVSFRAFGVSYTRTFRVMAGAS